MAMVIVVTGARLYGRFHEKDHCTMCAGIWQRGALTQNKCYPRLHVWVFCEKPPISLALVAAAPDTAGGLEDLIRPAWHC